MLLVEIISARTFVENDACVERKAILWEKERGIPIYLYN